MINSLSMPLRGYEPRAIIGPHMTSYSYVLFDTAIGRCGIAWGGQGIVAVQLPEAHELKTRARILKRRPDAREASPPPDVQRAIDGIVALLRGEATDFSTVALDLDGIEPFERRVYEIARTIAPGATLTYGEIATRLGDRGLARDVGQALGRNPVPLIVPCHRVLGGRRQGRRLLRQWRRHHQAAAAFDRRRAHQRRAHPVRR